MNENYLGPRLTDDARASVLNENYLCMYVTLLVARSTETDPDAFIQDINEGVAAKFGRHLRVHYVACDGHRELEDVLEGMSFYLGINNTGSPYYSKEVH